MVQVVSAVALSFGFLLWLVGIVGWIIRRKRKPLTARDPGLTTILVVVYFWCYLSLVISSTGILEENLATGAYVALSSATLLFNSYLWIGVRLYLIYSLSESKTKAMTAAVFEPDEKITKHRWIYETFVLSTFRLVLSWIVVTIFEIGMYLAISALLIFGLKAPEMYLGVEVALVAVAKCICFVILSFKLRGVRDNFHIKTELRAIGIWWIFASILLMGLGIYFHDLVFGLLCFSTTISFILSFVWPVIVSFRWKEDERKNSFSHSESDDYQFVECLDSKDLYPFFLQHLKQSFRVQELYLYQQLLQFRNEPDMILRAKAILIWERFLKIDAYMFVDVSHHVLEEIEPHLDPALTTDVPRDLFLKIEITISRRLEADFSDFKFSDEGRKTIEKISSGQRLEKGFELIGIA